MTRSIPVELAWRFEPVIVASLLCSWGLYLRRWARVRAGGGGRRAAPAWRAVSFSCGVLVVAAALMSPVDSIGEQLASGHMVQHLLLADVAAVLIILGFTKVILRPVARPLHRLERAAGPFGHPAFGVVAYVGVMAVYHVPAVYDAALETPLIHAIGHLAFAAAGGLYWWHLISPIRSRLRLGGLGPIIYMAVTKILVGFVGILLAFSPELLYTGYGGVDITRWGMTTLDDQQVAGLIMGLEQSLVMGVALAYLFYRMLAEADRDNAREEHLQDRAAARSTP